MNYSRYTLQPYSIHHNHCQSPSSLIHKLLTDSSCWRLQCYYWNIYYHHVHRFSSLGLFLTGCTRWRHQMETFSMLLTLCEGNIPVTDGFPSQRPMTRGFDFYFDLRLNKRLSKQCRRRWFETSSHSLWRHWNEDTLVPISLFITKADGGSVADWRCVQMPSGMFRIIQQRVWCWLW